MYMCGVRVSADSGPQNWNSSLRVLAGNALTTVLAGFALTSTSLPNISFLPAFVAGFLRVLIITRPGTTNLPFFLVSSVPMLAKVDRAVLATLLFPSQASAIAASRALLVMAVPFIIGAIVAGDRAAAKLWVVSLRTRSLQLEPPC